jgi:hypothetical protein
MTKPEGAPREFWIEKGSLAYRAVTSKDELAGWTHNGGPFHVIEHSAYQTLLEKCEALEKERDEFKAAFNIMEERSQFYFKEICDHNKKILEWDEVYKNKLNDNNKLQARFTELLGLANEMRENLKSDLVDDYECEIKFDDFKKREGL